MGEQTVWRPTMYERGPRVGATAALRIGASAADVGWFTADEADELTVIEAHRGVLDHAFGCRPAPYWD